MLMLFPFMQAFTDLVNLKLLRNLLNLHNIEYSEKAKSKNPKSKKKTPALKKYL